MTRLSVALLFTVALSSAASAQGNASFCQAYAANVAGMSGLAIKKNPACLDYTKGVHDNFQMHYDWCMKTPGASVQGAEANIRRLVTACSSNVQPPAARTSPPPNIAMDLNLRWGGSWRWTQNGRSDNTSTFEVLKNSTASYCYNRDCRTLPYQLNNGVFSFTKTGTDYYELRSLNNGDVLNGSYWPNRNDRNAPPAATVRFNRAQR